MALVNDHAEHVLAQWGIWCRMGKPGPRRYQSIAGKMEMAMIQQQSATGFTEEDDSMEVFDRRVMASIRTHTPDAFTAAYEYYAVGFAEDRHGIRELGKRLKIGKDAAAKRLYAAITAVAAVLEAI